MENFPNIYEQQRRNRRSTVVIITLFILFFLLAAGVTNSGVHTIAGYEGILCGITAMYAGIAQVLNEVYGRTVLPVFPRRTS
jgi:succinate-acetate transporter protein